MYDAGSVPVLDLVFGYNHLDSLPVPFEYCGGPPKSTKVKSTLPNEGQIFAGSNFFVSIAFPYHPSSEFWAAARFGEGQIFFSVLGYGTILHGVKFFRALSFFTSTEFLGVMFPQYISRGAQLRHKFCTTRKEVLAPQFTDT